MAKYAIIRCTDGNFGVHAEGTDLNGMKVTFHQYCASLWNDAGTTKAKIMIVDEQLNCVGDYREFIDKGE